MASGRHTAFISGAGRGNGRAIAVELAKRGCNVVVNGFKNRTICDETADEVKALDVDALVVMGDIGKPDVVKAMAKEALAHFGTIDILVNNAAIRAHKPFLEITDEDWHAVFDTDLHSAAYLSRAFLPGMAAQKWGRIVNLTGKSAIAGASERAHVAAAKNALWGLTRVLAREFGSSGITVNAVSPYMIGKGKAAPAAPDFSINAIGRKGKVTEVAALCGFLCSEDGGYISGQMIGVDGAAGR